MTCLALASGAGVVSAPTAQAAGEAPYCATAVIHPLGGTATADPPVHGCRYDTTGVTNDPGMAITKNGVAFVALSTGGLMRSTDHGASWTKVVVPPLANGDIGSGHGFVTVDTRTQRIYYATSGGVASCGDQTAGTVISWTEDLGTTWHGQVVSCETHDWGKVLTAKAPPGNPYPSAIYFFGVGVRLVGGQRIVYRSLDGAKTWQKMANISSALTEGGAGAAAPDGTLYYDYPYLPLDPAGVANTQIPFDPTLLCRAMVAVSEDYGVTWRQAYVPGSNECYATSGNQRVAVDAAGTVYRVWTDDADGVDRLVFSKDKGRTWSPPVVVQPPGTFHNNGLSTVVAGAAGHVAIASQDTASQVNPRVALTAGVGDWDTYLSETSDATAAAPTFTSVKLEPDTDHTYTTGQSPSETEGYIAMSPSGEIWTAFTRHTPFEAGQAPGETWAATLIHPTTATTPVRPTRKFTTKAPIVKGPVAAPGSLAATGTSPLLPGIASLLLLGAAAVVRRRRAL